MAASAGRYGVNIGTGAAGGAMAGMAFGPIGAGIGAGIGALGGGLSTLLSSSDEAKERERQKRLYEQKALEQARQQWGHQMDSIYGVDPRISMAFDNPYDPQKVSADFDAQMPEEPTPDYGRLVQSLGSLGGTVGQMSRTSALQDQLAQRSYDARVNATGNPWTQYADSGNADELEEMLKQARARSPGVTGFW